MASAHQRPPAHPRGAPRALPATFHVEASRDVAMYFAQDADAVPPRAAGHGPPQRDDNHRRGPRPRSSRRRPRRCCRRSMSSRDRTGSSSPPTRSSPWRVRTNCSPRSAGRSPSAKAGERARAGTSPRQSRVRTIAELFPDARTTRSTIRPGCCDGALAHGIYLADDVELIRRTPPSSSTADRQPVPAVRSVRLDARCVILACVCCWARTSPAARTWRCRVARSMIETAKASAHPEGDASDRPCAQPAEVWQLITEGNARIFGQPGRPTASACWKRTHADLLVLRARRLAMSTWSVA